MQPVARSFRSRQPRDLIPSNPKLPQLQSLVHECQGCPLYLRATQAVFGEGARSASMAFIGEQPGDAEDKQGHPFVGPAGKLLDRALVEAGIDRGAVYVSNAVKHFKFEERGKRRIHKKPSQMEIDACEPWLEAEMLVVKPKIVVCLGATAAQALLGRTFRLTQHRGEFFKHQWAPFVTATVHPSSILRAPDDEQRHLAFDSFVQDLKLIKKKLSTLGA